MTEPRPSKASKAWIVVFRDAKTKKLQHTYVVAASAREARRTVRVMGPFEVGEVVSVTAHVLPKQPLLSRKRRLLPPGEVSRRPPPPEPPVEKPRAAGSAEDDFDARFLRDRPVQRRRRAR